MVLVNTNNPDYHSCSILWLVIYSPAVQQCSVLFVLPLIIVNLGVWFLSSRFVASLGENNAAQ